MNRPDFTCDLNCPNGGTCCGNCAESRKNHLSESNKEFWDGKKGFLGENGCRLPRPEMPKECREYDCKQYTFTIKRFWIAGKWRDGVIKTELGYH